MSDPGAIVDQVIDANAKKADEYRRGKMGLLGFFVGQLVQERLGGYRDRNLNRSG